MKEDPYALCTDGSNDEGLVKLNPLLVRVFDINEGKVVPQLLDMGTSKKNDAESLFGLIDDALKKELNWNNSVAIGMDNTTVSSIVIEVIETVPFFKKKKIFTQKEKYLNTPKNHNKAHGLGKKCLDKIANKKNNQ